MSVQLPIPTQPEYDQNFAAWHQFATVRAGFIVKRLDIAQDIATETLIKLWQRSYQEAIRVPRSWIRVTARRLALNQLPQKPKRPPGKEADDDDAPTPLPPSGSQPSPPSGPSGTKPVLSESMAPSDSAQLGNGPDFYLSADADIIRYIMELRLTPTEKDIWDLHMQGLSAERIAAQTDKTEKRVQDIRSDVRKKLRAIRDSYFGLDR